MLRTRHSNALYAAILGVMLVAPARAQDGGAAGAIGEIPLPSSLRSALAAAGDRLTGDRSQFLLELIRRTHDSPIVFENDRRALVLRKLLDDFEGSRRQLRSGTAPETLPLPLPASIWLDVVFDKRERPDTLLAAIIRSRSASLLYSGLLSLDDATRAWLATKPDLIAMIALKHAAAFLVAAPALRVADGTIVLPGGTEAAPVWEALIGRRAGEPIEFVRALLMVDNGRLAYFFSAMAQLSPAQQQVALDARAPDGAARVANVRRLYAVFQTVAGNWKVDDQPFWRPMIDPAMLLAELPIDPAGRVMVPGTRRFWTAVFGDAEATRRDDPRLLVEGDPAEFVWLCEQVFTTKTFDYYRRYSVVLYASRVLGRPTADIAHDAVDAIRAAGAYPALVTSLERAQVVDLPAVARAARRAAQLSAIGNGESAGRAIASFQAVLAIVTRGASRGALPTTAMPSIVSSLSAVEVSKRGDYDGGLVRWLDSFFRTYRPRPASAPGRSGDAPDPGAGSIESNLLAIAAGAAADAPRVVEWEGTRYRLDLVRAESIRLNQFLGDRPTPYLTSAQTLVTIADGLTAGHVTRETIARAGTSLETVARAVGWDDRDSADSRERPAPGSSGQRDRYREIAIAMSRATRDSDAARLAPGLRALADDLLARGLIEIVYATALGRPDRTGIPIRAANASSRHDLGLTVSAEQERGPWERPVVGSDRERGWRVAGALLGLDITLAEFSLARLSLRPPAKPLLNDADRRVLVETAVLVEASPVDDRDRDAIVAAIGRGRRQLSAIRTSAEAVALADRVPLSAARRSLLSWVVVHDTTRISAFLSPVELYWLGLDGQPIPPSMYAWGAQSEARAGCLCLRLIDRRPWETFAGRSRSGILASAFPDLNLRLAELLADLKMPAGLLGPVLASATLDLVDNAISRHTDDRRALVEFVQSLRIDRVEQYLALLTTDGPLVPMDARAEGSLRQAQGGPPQ